MNANVYILNEYLQKIGISSESLDQWEKMKLLKPVGFTEDQTPFYTDQSVKEAEHILRLTELGYSLEEIEKIVKKVGLPSSGREGRTKDDSGQYLTVGALAEKAGISPRTIKHWEDKGIIVADMRSEGGFRLYSEIYILLCKLIQDLQRFGYSLEEIKTVSDYFREFLLIRDKLESFSPQDAENKLNTFLNEIKELLNKTNLLKEGIQRWEDLLKKKKKEIQTLKNQNNKRQQAGKGKDNA